MKTFLSSWVLKNLKKLIKALIHVLIKLQWKSYIKEKYKINVTNHLPCDKPSLPSILDGSVQNLQPVCENCPNLPNKYIYMGIACIYIFIEGNLSSYDMR